MEHELPFWEHISELRKRILICLSIFILTAIISFPYSSFLLKILKHPASGFIKQLVFFSPQEAFLVYMRITFFCGLIISLPVILYQIWKFVEPAMEERFRNSMAIFIVSCLLSFVFGMLFAYFILIPPALKFLLNFASEDLLPIISAQKYISFVIGIILAAGIVFEMPVISHILTKFGVLNYQFLRRKYKYAIVVILITSAIITPTTDIFNMILLAVPMLALYEMSIWVSKLTNPV